MKVPHIKTNDLKKGDYVLLRNEWLAEIKDNKGDSSYAPPLCNIGPRGGIRLNRNP